MIHFGIDTHHQRDLIVLRGDVFSRIAQIICSRQPLPWTVFDTPMVYFLCPSASATGAKVAATASAAILDNSRFIFHSPSSGLDESAWLDTLLFYKWLQNVTGEQEAALYFFVRAFK